MSTPLPSSDEARAELDRHIKKTVAVSALRKIGDITSDLEKEDRRGARVMVIAMVALVIVALCAGIVVFLLSERYKARKPVAGAVPTSGVAHKPPAPIR